MSCFKNGASAAEEASTYSVFTSPHSKPCQAESDVPSRTPQSRINKGRSPRSHSTEQAKTTCDIKSACTLLLPGCCPNPKAAELDKELRTPIWRHEEVLKGCTTGHTATAKPAAALQWVWLHRWIHAIIHVKQFRIGETTDGDTATHSHRHTHATANAVSTACRLTKPRGDNGTHYPGQRRHRSVCRQPLTGLTDTSTGQNRPHENLLPSTLLLGGPQPLAKPQAAGPRFSACDESQLARNTDECGALPPQLPLLLPPRRFAASQAPGCADEHG